VWDELKQDAYVSALQEQPELVVQLRDVLSLDSPDGACCLLHSMMEVAARAADMVKVRPCPLRPKNAFPPRPSWFDPLGVSRCKSPFEVCRMLRLPSTDDKPLTTPLSTYD
jgi:hypothetical protein